jgi:hypothetical protein
MKTRVINVKPKHSVEKSKLKDKNKVNKLINNIILLPNPYLKEEILFSNKAHKEILLSLIKSIQVKLMSRNNKNENTKKDNIIIYKMLLKELINKLSYVLNEKCKSKNYLESNINYTKKELKHKIKNKEIYNNKKNVNEDLETENYLETEIKEINFDGNELSKLKIQNFKIENELTKTDFLITIKLLELNDAFIDKCKDYICPSNLEDKKEIDEILYWKKKEKNDLLNKYIHFKNLQKYYIEQYQKEIDKMKKKIKLRNLINSEDVVTEQSCENIDTLDLNYSSLGNGMPIKLNI